MTNGEKAQADDSFQGEGDAGRSCQASESVSGDNFLDLPATVSTQYLDWLGEAAYVAGIVAAIDDCLILLASKRTTLEEKMIASYFNNLASEYGVVLKEIHGKLAQSSAFPTESALEQLRSLNLKVYGSAADLRKALRYDFNYVEQYFEYDFVSRLTQDDGFLGEIQQIVGCLT